MSIRDDILELMHNPTERRRPLAYKGTYEEKFLAYGWNCNSDTGCWIWDGPLDSKGYGTIRKQQRPRFAHRISYEYHKGAIPEGLIIRHQCDNPPCVNPEHLEVGTLADNVADKMERGRAVSPRGEEHGMARLTEEEVRTIRAEYVPRKVPLRVFAERYGVSEALVSLIIAGKKWSHVV